MPNLYLAWEKDIKAYCKKNNLDFLKAQKMVKGWSDNFVVLQYYDPSKGHQGLLNETPMPVVLRVTNVNGELVFEQTECTQKYLGL